MSVAPTILNMLLNHSYFLQALFDGGTVQDYLTKVHDFLTANPNEVLTLLFTNPEGVSLKDVWDPAFQASGVANLAFVPPSIPVKQSDVRQFLPRTIYSADDVNPHEVADAGRSHRQRKEGGRLPRCGCGHRP